MKIAFYIHYSTISAGGIYTYTIGILRQLFKSTELDKIIIITTKEISDTLNEFKKDGRFEVRIIDRKIFVNKIRMLNWYALFTFIHFIEEILRSKIIFNPVKNFLAKINPYSSVLQDDEVDLFHVPLQYSPIYKINIPVIVTMHDLQEYHFPEYFSLKEKLHRKINNRIAVKNSDHIICSFQHVKNDIVKYLKVNPGKISVCPPPFAENWFLSKNETDWNKLETKFKISKDYLLYPAATWKHKNHITLLEAIKRVRNEGIDIKLICTGNKTDFFEIIKQKIESLELLPFVHFLGIVPEADLIGLYKNSALVVIPTLYEAGSGPLYEAMRYGAPVICSNVTSLPDTVSNEDFIFDPNNLSDLVDKIKRGLKDDNYRRKNIENSKKRMEILNKTNYSDNFLAVFKSVLIKSQK